MANKLDRIRDSELRESLAQAHASLRSGDFQDVVKRSSEAYAELLRRKPELTKGPNMIRNVLFFPNLGARLQLNSTTSAPEIIYDREKFIFSEAITYFEFTVDSLIKNGV